MRSNKTRQRGGSRTSHGHLESRELLIKHGQFAKGGNGEANPANKPQPIEGAGIIPFEMNEQNQQGEADSRLKESNSLEALIRSQSGPSQVVNGMRIKPVEVAAPQEGDWHHVN